MHKAIGAVALIFGVFLLVRGHDVSQSVNSQVKNIFIGSPSDKVMYYYLGGAVCSAIGLAELFRHSK